jgi:mannose-6-phosphate isomerase-like protein (cupin superfamily)
MSYNNIIVKKPWGYEYLVYENDEVGLWCLHIDKDQQTSMHCHPNKTTGLILLDGEVDVSFFNDTFKLLPGRKLMIRRGLFHSTKALSKNGSIVFEIESPKQKHDLVRLEDSYGRKAKPYEGSAFEALKDKNCIWFTDPSKNSSKEYNFANCKIILESITGIDAFKNKDDKDNIMFLKGGILSKDNKVAQPGDVVTAHIVKKLLETFDQIDPETVVMTIKRNT